jgi:hypothetical protein
MPCLREFKRAHLSEAATSSERTVMCGFRCISHSPEEAKRASECAPGGCRILEEAARWIMLDIGDLLCMELAMNSCATWHSLRVL